MEFLSIHLAGPHPSRSVGAQLQRVQVVVEVKARVKVQDRVVGDPQDITIHVRERVRGLAPTHNRH